MTLEDRRHGMTARRLVLLSSALLGVGLVAPCMTIVPRMGELTPVLKVFKPELGVPQQVSIAGGVRALLVEGQIAIGVVILVFSILFPILKLSVLWCVSDALTRPGNHDRLLHAVEKLGKYSMLDVFVLAVIVLSFKRLPGSSAVTISWGAIVFMVSVLLTLPVPAILKRRDGEH